MEYANLVPSLTGVLTGNWHPRARLRKKSRVETILFIAYALFSGLGSGLLVAQNQAQSSLQAEAGLRRETVRTGKASNFQALTRRKFRYIFSTDLGFLLGFNGTALEERAIDKIERLKPYFINGNNLRYGFSATLNWGMIWLQKKRTPKASSGNNSVSSYLHPKTFMLQEPRLGNQHKWAIGFQLRNMISISNTSLTYFSSLGNFYSQQDQRASYAFQPIVSFSILFSPLWEMQFFLGPSLNVNFYQHSTEEYYFFHNELLNRNALSTNDSPELNFFSLGAVAGISLSRYFYSFLAAGISTQFVVNVSPHRGPNAAQLSLGQFVLGLYIQISL